MKIALRGAQQLIERAEERISKLEDRAIEITHSEEHREKKDEMNEQSLREMWGTIKCTNEQVTGVTQREERERREQKMVKGITANHPKLNGE